MVFYTDANDQCIGAVFNQPCLDRDSPVPDVLEEVPLYFLSHRLSKTQQRWSVIEKETHHYACLAKIRLLLELSSSY